MMNLSATTGMLPAGERCLLGATRRARGAGRAPTTVAVRSQRGPDGEVEGGATRRGLLAGVVIAPLLSAATAAAPAWAAAEAVAPTAGEGPYFSDSADPDAPSRCGQAPTGSAVVGVPRGVSPLGGGVAECLRLVASLILFHAGRYAYCPSPK